MFPKQKWGFLGTAKTGLCGTVSPQALDCATSNSLWALFASVTTYVLYAIVADLSLRWPTIEEMKSDASSEEVEPHSEEVRHDTIENVTFDDSRQGPTVDCGGPSIDPLRSQPLNVDATLDNFFSRPLKIHEQDWGVGNPFFFRINPWQLYFENARVINRIANYKLMKAKLHVKVLLNGNAFHYGRAIVAYNPFPADDDLTVDRTLLDVDVVAASQRPHIWLNPTTSEGGEMVLPFFFYKNLWDVVAMDWRKMGLLDAHSLQPLKHANGAVDTVTVSVFAWAEDVSFSVPTQVEPGAISPQALEIYPHADEYGKKPVSRIAGAVAKAAGYLADVPVIGLYARATEIGATAVGAMATLFGFSSPVHTEEMLYVPRGKTNYAVTNTPNDSYKLTMDVKQELSIDPRTVGLDATDELTIKNIASKESYLTEVPWAIGASAETLLWQAVVDPSLHRQLGAEKHFPAPAFAVMPFKYWRGSMRFRFMVVSSNYHKGRLKIVYDPEGGIGNAEYNTAYTTLVDISTEKDFSIDVGWGQAFTWRRHRGLLGNQLQSDVGTVGYTSSTVDYGNGTISVYVVNELTVPNSTINNDIQINVFISMLDDFEVCVPTEEYIDQLRLTISPQSLEIARSDVSPHADEEKTVVVTNPPVIDTMASKSTVADPSAMFHFGEAVGSFRQLMKRYQLLEWLIPSTQADMTNIKYTRPMYPMTPGYIPAATSAGPPNYLLTLGDYNFVYMSHIRYVSSAFAGMRGGVRYLADLTPFIRPDAPPPTALIKRRTYVRPITTSASVPSSTLSTPAGPLMNQHRNSIDGAAILVSPVNPTISFEVPYYSNYRFRPAKMLDKPVAISDNYQDAFTMDLVVQPITAGTNWSSLHVAAAEDFTCFWYLGPPIFYAETSFPIS